MNPPGGWHQDPRRPGQRLRESELGGEQVEGRQAVRALLAAGRRRVRDVWISESATPGPSLAAVESLAVSARVPVRRVAQARLEAEARTDAPQGVLAHAAALEDLLLDDLASAERPFLVVADGVTDPRNLGALARAAEIAGVTGLVLPRRRAVHITPAVTKAAAGAIEYLSFALVPGVPNALASLESAGVWTVGLAPDAPASLFEADLPGSRVALVVGAEGRGLSSLVRRRCDLVVRIPQHGRTESLNLATAAAVACFELARRR